MSKGHTNEGWAAILDRAAVGESIDGERRRAIKVGADAIRGIGPFTAPGNGGAQTGIYFEIADERARQDKEWGGPDHDDRHSLGDWVRFIMKQLGRASECTYTTEFDLMADDGKSKDALYRKRMVKIAALAVAAIETFDRQEARERA